MKKCFKCKVKDVFDAHATGLPKTCLDCRINKKKRGGRDRTRDMVRARDNHQCQDCGKGWNEGMRRFDVHHLNGLCGKKSMQYDRVSEMDGLITLCHKCHFNRPEHKTKKLSTH